MQGHAVTLSALAKKHDMSLRELRDFTAAAMGHRLLCGTPEFVADGLEEWFVAGAADGFNLMPPWFPGAFDDFVDQVVPILQRRGLFRTEYAGRTLPGFASPASFPLGSLVNSTNDQAGLSFDPRLAYPGESMIRALSSSENRRSQAFHGAQVPPDRPWPALKRWQGGHHEPSDTAGDPLGN
jgi:hypothetical protein